MNGSKVTQNSDGLRTTPPSYTLEGPPKPAIQLDKGRRKAKQMFSPYLKHAVPHQRPHRHRALSAEKVQSQTQKPNNPRRAVSKANKITTLSPPDGPSVALAPSYSPLTAENPTVPPSEQLQITRRDHPTYPQRQQSRYASPPKKASPPSARTNPSLQTTCKQPARSNGRTNKHCTKVTSSGQLSRQAIIQRIIN